LVRRSTTSNRIAIIGIHSPAGGILRFEVAFEGALLLIFIVGKLRVLRRA